MYKKTGPGRPAAGTQNHLKGNVDMVLLAHTAGSVFTCNKRITVDDTFGHGNDASLSVLSCMYDLEYEGGATDLPMRALHFLINRSANSVTHAVHGNGLRLFA